MSVVTAHHLDTVEYEESCRLQEALATARASGTAGDTLLLLQHPAVITIGRDGGAEDIVASAPDLRQLGIPVLPTDRGGRATYHGPGQLVVYPILRPADGDLHAYVWRLEETTIRVLSSYGLKAGRVDRHPGVWIGASNGNGGGRKVASVGLAVRDRTTRHGLSLNVAPDMSHFDLLISCGNAQQKVTSMEKELGWAPDLTEVAGRFGQAFGQVFQYQMVEGDAASLEGYLEKESVHPPWLRKSISPQDERAAIWIERLLEQCGVHTVCQEAHCPNIAECFAEGTATFMILGNVCSRGCRFCAVSMGKVAPLDPGEPLRVANAAAQLDLEHVVITSVTRDDLPDGGAGQFAAAVRTVRQRLPGAVVEVLVPDFGGSQSALETVLAAEPQILNHNVETVPRLYPRVRPGAGYRRSLGLLARAKELAPGTVTKSGLMLGLGENTAEVVRTLYDLRQARCDLLTLGQYLQPTGRQLPVERFVAPEEFDGYVTKAKSLGFRGVAAGPLVRSSHRAGVLWQQALSGFSL